MNEIVAIAICVALFLAFGLLQRKKEEPAPRRTSGGCGTCGDPCDKTESSDAAC